MLHAVALFVRLLLDSDLVNVLRAGASGAPFRLFSSGAPIRFINSLSFLFLPSYFLARCVPDIVIFYPSPFLDSFSEIVPILFNSGTSIFWNITTAESLGNHSLRDNHTKKNSREFLTTYVQIVDFEDEFMGSVILLRSSASSSSNSFSLRLLPFTTVGIAVCTFAVFVSTVGTAMVSIPLSSLLFVFYSYLQQRRRSHHDQYHGRCLSLSPVSSSTTRSYATPIYRTRSRRVCCDDLKVG